jgi:hypothetical protein
MFISHHWTANSSAVRADHEPGRWRSQLPIAVAAVFVIVLISVGPAFAGYVVAPKGLSYTGAATYAEDEAQHEMWAVQLATNLRVKNLLTPEPTPAGWFFTPLELAYGLVQRWTGISYAVTSNAFALVCAPLLAAALLCLARRSEIRWAAIAAVVSLLAGPFAPLFVYAAAHGLYMGNVEILRSAGGDGTPVFAGPGPYLLLALVALVLLPTSRPRDPGRGFRFAGGALFVLGTV